MRRRGYVSGEGADALFRRCAAVTLPDRVGDVAKPATHSQGRTALLRLPEREVCSAAVALPEGVGDVAELAALPTDAPLSCALLEQAARSAR